MYVNQEKKLIYLAHPRTASNATAETLIYQAGFIKFPMMDHHSQLFDEGSPVTNENRDDWVVFTTVRNHWDTMISWMFRRKRDPSNVESFKEEYKTNTWIKNNKLWWLHSYDADHILRFENLEKELNSLLRKHSLPKVSLLLRNVTEQRGRRHYSEFYTPRTKKFVRLQFEKEIDRFGYEYNTS